MTFLRGMGLGFGSFNTGIGLLVHDMNAFVLGCSLFLACFALDYLVHFDWRS